MTSVGAAVLALAGAGCDHPFSPVWKLDKPRVLGIRSEPVELVPDASVALDSLVYLPPGSGTPSYAWSWCPSVGDQTTGYACAMTAETFAQTLDPDGGLGLTFSFDLGSAPTATFVFPGDPAVLKLACTRVVNSFLPTDAGVDGGADAGEADAGESDAGVSTSDGGTDGGFDFAAQACRNGLTFTVQLTVTVDGHAYKALRNLTVQLEAPTSMNVNPTIDGLTFSAALVAAPDGGAPDGGRAVLAVVPTSASESFEPALPAQGGAGPARDAGPVDTDGGMFPGVDAGRPGGPDGGMGGPPQDAGAPVDPDAGVVGSSDGGAEALDGGADAGSRLQWEGLQVAWYVESGTLTSATTNLPQTRGSDARDWNLLGNWWVPPAGFGGSSQSTKFILVVRDSRGGIGWTVVDQAGGGVP